MKVAFILFLSLVTWSLMAEEKIQPLTLTNQYKVSRQGNLFYGGQPTAEQIKELRKQGFTTVISLRTAKEKVGFDEAEVAKANGLKFVSIPVEGMGGMTKEKAQKIRKAVADAGESSHVLLHCASGGRVKKFLDMK